MKEAAILKPSKKSSALEKIYTRRQHVGKVKSAEFDPDKKYSSLEAHPRDRRHASSFNPLNQRNDLIPRKYNFSAYDTRDHYQSNRKASFIPKNKRRTLTEHRKFTLNCKQQKMSHSNRLRTITHSSQPQPRLQENNYQGYDLRLIMDPNNFDGTLADRYSQAIELLSLYFNGQSKDRKSPLISQALQKLQYIQGQAHGMSMSVMVMEGMCYYQLGFYNEAIRYMNKAYSEYHDFSKLFSESEVPSHRHYQSLMDFIAFLYFTLAKAYLHTFNYLCALNVLQTWQVLFYKNKQTIDKLNLNNVSAKNHYVQLSMRPQRNVFVEPNLKLSLQVKNQEPFTQVKGSPKLLHRKSQDALQLRTSKLNYLVGSEGYLLKARINVYSKNYDRAIEDYINAVEINPLSLQANLELSALYYHKSLNFQKTIGILNAFTCRFSADAQEFAYVNLQKCMLMTAQKRYEEALKILQNVTWDGMKTEVHYYRGEIYFSNINSLGKQAKGPVQDRLLEQCLEEYSDGIICYTSMQYICRCYHRKIILLVFKKDYYAAQYELEQYAKRQPELDLQNSLNFMDLKNGLYLNIEQLGELVDGVINILKKKLSIGLQKLKQLLGRLLCNTYINKSITISIYEQIYYAYLQQRKYNKSIQYINKMQNDTIITDINKKILSSIMALQNREYLDSIMNLDQAENNYKVMDDIPAMKTININIRNGIYTLKALAYIKLYLTSPEGNRDILLSAEELLKHNLVTQSQNYQILYILATIYYELQLYQETLKCIRLAIEHSDDHMIKHYYLKANCKLLLQRYEEAVKDYSNAIIVQSQNTSNQNQDGFYHQQELMINQCYLNRGIAYIKLAHENIRQYTKHETIIASYKDKAYQDLKGYFKQAFKDKDYRYISYVGLFLYTDQPQYVFKLQKKTGLKFSDNIVLNSYLKSKELNSCIDFMSCMISKRKNTQEAHALRVDHQILSCLKLTSSCSIKSFQKGIRTLENQVTSEGGTIFQKYAILFFIGVFHFQLSNYQQSAYYFKESYEQSPLIFQYCKQQFCEQMFSDKLYTIQEIMYNIGIALFMQGQFQSAKQYLFNHPDFMELLSEDDIDEDEENIGSQQEDDQKFDITPFPTNNRLCSIYPLKHKRGKSFRLSFCLPRGNHILPELFNKYEAEPALVFSNKKHSQIKGEGDITKYKHQSLMGRCQPMKRKYQQAKAQAISNNEDKLFSALDSNLQIEEDKKQKLSVGDEQLEQECGLLRIDKKKLSNPLQRLSLLDIEIRAMAPWLDRHMDFTHQPQAESIELTERSQKVQENKRYDEQ